MLLFYEDLSCETSEEERGLTLRPKITVTMEFRAKLARCVLDSVCAMLYTPNLSRNYTQIWTVTSFDLVLFYFAPSVI